MQKVRQTSMYVKPSEVRPGDWLVTDELDVEVGSWKVLADRC